MSFMLFGCTFGWVLGWDSSWFKFCFLFHYLGDSNTFLALKRVFHKGSFSVLLEVTRRILANRERIHYQKGNQLTLNWLDIWMEPTRASGQACFDAVSWRGINETGNYMPNGQPLSVWTLVSRNWKGSSLEGRREANNWASRSNEVVVKHRANKPSLLPPLTTLDPLYSVK